MSAATVSSWKGKNKKMLNRISESSHLDVNTVVCRATSAQPAGLHALHSSSHPTPSPTVGPVSSGFCQQHARSFLHLSDSQHTSTSDLYQHDRYNNFQWKCWLKERCLKGHPAHKHVKLISHLEIRRGFCVSSVVQFHFYSGFLTNKH